MPHCTTDLAHYLGKFIVGLAGMLYLHITLLKEEERIRERFESDSSNTDSRTLGPPMVTATSLGCRERCTLADATGERDCGYSEEVIAVPELICIKAGKWLWSQMKNLGTIAAEISYPVGFHPTDNYNEPPFLCCTCCQPCSKPNTMRGYATSSPGRFALDSRSRRSLCRRPRCLKKPRRGKRRMHSSISTHRFHGPISRSSSLRNKHVQASLKDRAKLDVADNDGNTLRSITQKKAVPEASGEEGFHVRVNEEPLRTGDPTESNIPLLNEMATQYVTDNQTIDAATSSQQLQALSPFRNHRQITESEKYENDSSSSIRKSSGESSPTRKNNDPSRRKFHPVHDNIIRQLSIMVDVKSSKGNRMFNESPATSESEVASTNSSENMRTVGWRDPSRLGDSQISGDALGPGATFPRNSSMQSRSDMNFHPRVTHPYQCRPLHRNPCKGALNYRFRRLRRQEQTAGVLPGKCNQFKWHIYPRSPICSTCANNSHARPRVSPQVLLVDRSSHRRSERCQNSYDYRQWNGETPLLDSPYRPTLRSSEQSLVSSGIFNAREHEISHTLGRKRRVRRVISAESLDGDDSLREHQLEAHSTDSDSEQEPYGNIQKSWPGGNRSQAKNLHHHSFLHASPRTNRGKSIARNRREYSWHVGEIDDTHNMRRPYWTSQLSQEVTYIKR